MALALINAQTNDAKILYLTDNSTWGSDSVPALANVTAANFLISYKTPELDDYTSELNVNITSVFTTANGDASLLIFPLIFGSEPTLDATPVGINAFPDGIWKIQYTVTTLSGDTYILIELLLDMQIKTKIYQNLAQVPIKYMCANNYYTKPIDDVLLSKTLHYSMEANAYVAKKDEVLNILDTLQRQNQ